MAALSGLAVERVAAQRIRAMPATTEPALATFYGISDIRVTLL